MFQFKSVVNFLHYLNLLISKLPLYFWTTETALIVLKRKIMLLCVWQNVKKCTDRSSYISTWLYHVAITMSVSQGRYWKISLFTTKKSRYILCVPNFKRNCTVIFSALKTVSASDVTFIDSTTNP